MRSIEFCQLLFTVMDVVEMQYGFLVSLHPSAQDSVVSKGIRDGLFGPMHKYPSIDEMHSICHTASCTAGKVFVEVGSAIGMVSLYMTSRGMTVYAYDPLLPNIDRLSESRCLNRERQRANSSLYSLSTFHVFWNAVGDSPRTLRIESEPNNLAATMRGGGSIRADVQVVTIDQTVDENAIEIMLLTCQGSEHSALLGATEFLQSGKIRNIVWRVHATHRTAATRIADLLQGHGYQFYKLEAARSSGSPPAAMSYTETLNYIHSRDGHPNILAQKVFIPQ